VIVEASESRPPRQRAATIVDAVLRDLGSLLRLKVGLELHR